MVSPDYPATESAIENIFCDYSDHPNDMTAAVAAMRTSAADAKLTAFVTVSRSYWMTLSDAASSRPYASGQLTLNNAIVAVQNLAAANKWTVPQGVDTPSTANPCYETWLPYNP